MEFERKVSEVWQRIRNSDAPMAVFTVHDRIICVKRNSNRFDYLLRDNGKIFIGVYTNSIPRDELSCDISLIVDELPDRDEECTKPKTNRSSTRRC